MTAIANTVAQAGQTDFDVPFPFLHVDHVEVRANGIRWYPTEWVNSTRLRLSAPPGAGSFVEIRRNTPIDTQLVKFTDGAVLTQEDLNMAVQQILFKQQEIEGLYAQTLLAARVRIGEAGGVAVTPEDAANQIASLVTEQQILADFRQRVTELDITAETILSQLMWNQESHERARTLIRTEKTERLEEDAALASRMDIVAAEVDANHAAIIEEATARVTAFEAQAELWALLGAKTSDGSAFVLDLNSVKVSEGTSLAQRLAGLDASVGTNSAAIVAEANARADAIGAVAEDINVVSTSVGGLTSSVSSLSLSVNGLASRWGIELNTNGHVSGIVMNNGGERSDFTVLVDKFRILNPANGNLLQPFVVENGVVKITTLFAGVINADLIQAGRLNVGQLVWDGDIWTAKLAANATTQTLWITLPSDISLVSTAEASILTLNVPGVTSGELLKVAALISIGSSDDLRGNIRMYHTPPGGSRALIYSQDIKLDSDGGASTRIPLPTLARVPSAAAGAHTFELTFQPLDVTLHTIRAGTDLEVTRYKR